MKHETRTPEDICRELVDALRAALSPLAGLTDAEILARADLTDPEARLVIATRRIVREYDG
jgi:hypothetical protein